MPNYPTSSLNSITKPSRREIMSLPLKIRSSEADDAMCTTKIQPVTAASTPVSPGPATPTSFRTPSFSLKISEDIITPPARPKSTPFPQQDETEDEATSLRLEDSHRHALSTLENHTSECSPSSTLVLTDLPAEVHEIILDHLLGTRASTSTRTLTPGSSAALRGWGTALRHSRRRERTDLALVSNVWRVLVQERLYRHIKVKGTRGSLEATANWFLEHPHLQKYVKHIEVWIPVWERRSGGVPENFFMAPTSPDRTAFIRTMNDHGAGLDAYSNIGAAYQLSSGNATLESIFDFVSCGFSETCIMTLEGGHGKQPPRVQHFNEVATGNKQAKGGDSGDMSYGDKKEPLVALPAVRRGLPCLENIRCLVIKGAWNIVRSEHDLRRILNAIPKVEEIHCTYQEANTDAYLTIAHGLPLIPSQISHVNVLLEGNYTGEVMTPSFWANFYPRHHICHEMAKVTPQMEHFQYTGRVCYQFFEHAIRLADPDKRGNTKLRSLDLTVKNTCRPFGAWPDGCNINDWPFIQSFERLIAAGIKSLSRFRGLKYLRIRFIDLDSPLPLMNPYFQLKDGKCSGIWSDNLVELLTKHRPEASYISLEDCFGTPNSTANPKDIFPRQRPVSIKTSVYQTIADPMFQFPS